MRCCRSIPGFYFCNIVCNSFRELTRGAISTLRAIPGAVLQHVAGAQAEA